MTNKNPNYLEEVVDINKVYPLNTEVLVKIKKISEKTSGGIIIPTNQTELANNAKRICEIISMGEFAFKEHKTRPKKGDTCLVERYLTNLIQEDDEFEYKIIKDYEFLAIYKK